MAFIVDQANLTNILKTYPVIEIPSYQRDYDWTQTEWTQLLRDLLPYTIEKSTYFMGPINAERRPSGDGIVVADGQQRITTLLICLSALNAVTSYSHSDLIDPLLFSNAPQTDRSRYISRLHDQTPIGSVSLQASLLASKPIDAAGALSKHDRAFNYFFQELTALSNEECEGFLDLLTERLIFARVVAQEPGSGIKMFERANTRGRPLTFTDKLKSHLIGMADRTAADEVVNNWQSTVSNLREVSKYEDKSFVNWLATDWFTEERTLRASEGLDFARSVIDAKGALAVSRSLLEYSSAVKNIWNGLTPRGAKQCGSLQNLRHFPRFLQLQRLLPAARHLDEDSFVELAKQVENTVCVLAFAKAFPPDIEKKLPQMLLGLRDMHETNKEVRAVFQILRTLRNDNSYNFGYQIINGSYGDQPKSYLLALWGLIEQFVENSNRPRNSQNPRFYVNPTSMSVEHILPQSAKARDAAREFGSHYAPQNRQRIANLTPLEGGLNYGMEPFSKKVKNYQSSKFHLTMTMSSSMTPAGMKAFKELLSTYLPPYKKWDYSNLEKRAQRLYELSSLVLDFDPDDVDVEVVQSPTLEAETQFPRVADLGALADAVVLIAEGERVVLKTLTTLRFLGIADESESGEVELTDVGLDLSSRTKNDQTRLIREIISDTPYVNVWRELTPTQREAMLKKDITEICGTDRSTIRGQIQDCLDEWVEH